MLMHGLFNLRARSIEKFSASHHWNFSSSRPKIHLWCHSHESISWVGSMVGAVIKYRKALCIGMQLVVKSRNCFFFQLFQYICCLPVAIVICSGSMIVTLIGTPSNRSQPWHGRMKSETMIDLPFTFLCISWWSSEPHLLPPSSFE